jgi:cephalosporin hydroxylase
MVTIIDEDAGTVTVSDAGGERQYQMASNEGFMAASKAWLRCGWDAKYVYGFSWLGRPIIQLPEDLIRIQEIIYRVKPDVIIETGIAHGGSLIFYASLCKAMGKGKIVGIDVDIRSHNRQAIDQHELSPFITLIEGSSIDPAVIEQVERLIGPASNALVVLDSNHSKDHVLAELNMYAPFVALDSYMVVADGIMAELRGAPRSKSDWRWNNPLGAIESFLRERPNFMAEEPAFPFNEGAVTGRVTYWPQAYLRRTS